MLEVFYVEQLITLKASAAEPDTSNVFDEFPVRKGLLIVQWF